MYSLHDYAAMLADQIRLNAYRDAIRHVVEPGDIVLDLGAGTGVLAFLACSRGASKVYAIEPNDVITVAGALANENSLSEKITFIKAFSTDVELPERVDVIVSDLRGTLPLHGSHLSTIIDARRRFLKSGGKLIPSVDKIWIAVLSSEHAHRKHGKPWGTGLPEVKLNSLSASLLSIPRKTSGVIGELLTEPACWITLDYASLELVNAEGLVNWIATKQGCAHGLCVWFDSVLAENAAITNSPAAPLLNYGQMFFPWSSPVLVERGDHINVRLDARLRDGAYVWSWQTEIYEMGPGSKKKALFDQTSL